LSHYFHIDTPENLTLEAETAGIGSRCVAAMIDYLIILVVMIVFVFFLRGTLVSTDHPQWVISLLVLAVFITYAFYHLIFEIIWNGQTPGKRLFGLRVVHMTGMPLTASGALVRNLVRLFDFFPVFYGIGLLTAFFNGYNQRCGDLAARTIVIYEKSLLTLNSLREELRTQYFFIAWYQPLPPHIDITNLAEQDRYLVVNFLRRRFEFVNRGPLAVALAVKYARLMELDDPRFLMYGYRAEEFLEHIAWAFELRDREDANLTHAN
jgi:uncharacterized RDD family membrane protein YckC